MVSEYLPEWQDGGTHQPEEFTRRQFLADNSAAVAALVAAAFAGGSGLTYFTIRPESRERDIRGLREEYDRRRTPLVAEYLRTGKVHDQALVRNLVLYQELISYLESAPKVPQKRLPPHYDPPSSFEEFVVDHYRPMANAVFAEFQMQRERTLKALGDAYRPFHELVDLKVGLEEHLGASLTYNRSYNSPLYSVFRARDGKIRLQCSSASQLLLLLAHENVIGGQLVGIHSNGHLFPGTLSPDGVVSAVEMRHLGPAQSVLGSLEDLRQNPGYQLRIAKVEDVFALSLIDDPTQASQAASRAALLDTAPRDQGTPHSLSTFDMNIQRRDPLAFGEVEVPAGDQIMEHRNVVDPSIYAVGGKVHTGEPSSDIMPEAVELLPSDFLCGTYGVVRINRQFIEKRTGRILSREEAFRIRGQNYEKAHPERSHGSGVPEGFR
jgi:hypothetical protein